MERTDPILCAMVTCRNLSDSPRGDGWKSRPHYAPSSHIYPIGEWWYCPEHASHANEGN